LNNGDIKKKSRSRNKDLIGHRQMRSKSPLTGNIGAILIGYTSQSIQSGTRSITTREESLHPRRTNKERGQIREEDADWNKQRLLDDNLITTERSGTYTR
jgi:hypothetical protein